MTRMIFRTITFVEVVKLMRIHRSRVSATYSVGLDAFLVIFFNPNSDQVWDLPALVV